jgi:hypothetical protein
MLYRELKPPWPLSPYIKCFWRLERRYEDFASGETVWPDGNVELLFHDGDRYRLSQEAGRLSHSFVIGPLTRYVKLGSEGQVRLIGVRFYPWRFLPFFGLPMQELRDQVIPFADLVGSEAGELEERVLAATSDQAIAVLQDYLLRRLQRTDLLLPPMIVPLVQKLKTRTSIFSI